MATIFRGNIYYIFYIVFCHYINRLVYDADSDTFQDSEDVTINVPGFGGTDGVEFLTPGTKTNLTPYMNDLVEYFVERGYVRGNSIRAAPYDWRLAAGEPLLSNFTIGMYLLWWLLRWLLRWLLWWLLGWLGSGIAVLGIYYIHGTTWYNMGC